MIHAKNNTNFASRLFFVWCSDFPSGYTGSQRLGKGSESTGEGFLLVDPKIRQQHFKAERYVMTEYDQD
jgi:hypothetical protein